MAQQTTVRFIDDLDGSDASSTVTFALDGRSYEIDLSEDNAAKLRDALAPFVDAARKSGGRGASTQRQTRSAEKPAPRTASRPTRSASGPGRTATR